MTTSLINAEVALSKEIGDYWAGTTDGAGGATTLVDSALKAKANDWITDETYVILTEEPAGAAAIYDERKVSSLDNSTGTLTTLTFAAAPGTGIDYSLHRLFQPSEKRRALVTAAKDLYPALFSQILNEELVSGNWLEDGSFERWTSSTDPTKWTDTTLTATQTTTSPYFKHGLTSCKLDTAAGTLVQSISENDNLKFLAGRNVTFTLQVWCDTASALRISINDGTTQTYSSYHVGDSAYTADNPRDDSLYVTQYIDKNATQITFTIHSESAASTSYVDDARVISDYNSGLYVGHLGIAHNTPHQVYIEPYYYSRQEPWIRVRDYRVDKNGYLFLPTTYPSDLRLRLLGTGYHDFTASGVASTAWTATVDLDEPELQVLVAQAALYLYTWMSMPNDESGTREAYQQMIGFWKQELKERKSRFGMKSPGATVHWGIR